MGVGERNQHFEPIESGKKSSQLLVVNVSGTKISNLKVIWKKNHLDFFVQIHTQQIVEIQHLSQISYLELTMVIRDFFLQVLAW